MALLDSLDWFEVRRHYEQRIRVHKNLISLARDNLVFPFANLALGISDPVGNYSAAEHGLGSKILGTNVNAERLVLDLARKFRLLNSASVVPELIRDAGIKFLQIGVGSEISCMVHPEICWVANARTIWTHLVIKHADNTAKADEELRLYREADVTSEMAYAMWSDIHAQLDVALTRIADLSKEFARRAKVVPGDVTYLWADAIASSLYDLHHPRGKG